MPTPTTPTTPTTPAVTAPSAYPGQPPGYPTQPPSYSGQAPAYPQQGYGAYGAPPSADPYAAYSYQYAGAPGRKTNGLAIASLVCGIGGFLFFIPIVLAIVFGFVSRAQIRNSNGTQGGQGLATAGIILGFAWIAFFVIVFSISAATNNNTGVVLPHLAALGGLGG